MQVHFIDWEIKLSSARWAASWWHSLPSLLPKYIQSDMDVCIVQLEVAGSVAFRGLGHQPTLP
jgi:hypothetical protein